MFDFPTPKPRRAKKPYRKPDSVKMLEAMANEATRKKYPNVPHLAPRTFRDDKSNDLTKCIMEYIRLTGGQSERISVTGRYIDQSKIFTNTLGQQRKVGTGKWIKPSMTKGSGDVSAVKKITLGGKIVGLTVKIEVKIGADKQSEDQKKYQQEVENAGGVYLLVKSFDDFIEKYNSLL